MSWRCPACSSVIQHADIDPKPLIGERYRCHVCRLSLDYDGETEKLVIAPFEIDHHVTPISNRARAIPAPLTPQRRLPRPGPKRRQV